jgi:hypothetical protein
MVVSLVNKNLALYEEKVTGLTCTSAISTGTQISTFRRNDEPMLRMGLHLMIEDVISFYGAIDRVQDSEIENLVAKIFANYWWMKLEEIAYVFNLGKGGNYGKIYGIISVKVIYEWIQYYDMHERDHERIYYNQELSEKSSKERLSIEELKALYKNPDTSTPPPPDGSQRMVDREDQEYKKAKAEYFRTKQEKK